MCSLMPVSHFLQMRMRAQRQDSSRRKWKLCHQNWDTTSRRTTGAWSRRQRSGMRSNLAKFLRWSLHLLLNYRTSPLSQDQVISLWICKPSWNQERPTGHQYHCVEALHKCVRMQKQAWMRQQRQLLEALPWQYKRLFCWFCMCVFPSLSPEMLFPIHLIIMG